MSKEISYSSEAKNKMKEGAAEVAKAVSVTLGGMGRNVVVVKNNSTGSTKDGVSVAKSISFEDKTKNAGASILKQVAEKTVEMAGDGTTTSIVIGNELIQRGVKMVESGASPVMLKKGMEKAVFDISQWLKSNSNKIKCKQDLVNIATVSANNDGEIGEFVGEVFDKIGVDGIVDIQRSYNNQTSIDVVSGYKFEKGYVSFRFVNNNKNECVLENPYILLLNKPVSILKEIIPALEIVAQSGRPVLIICDSLDGEALASVILNVMNGNLKACVVESPEYGQNRKDVFNDIATVCGCDYFDDQKSIKPENGNVLGSCEKVVVTKNSTTIIGGSGLSDKKAELVDSLKVQIADNVNDSFLKKRLAMINNSVASIKVGANTDIEVGEKIDRIDDAVRAAKSSLEEGYVIGGGTALLFVDSLTSGMSGDFELGYKSVIESVQKPFDKIMDNAGLNCYEKKHEVVSKGYGTVFNVATNKIENGFESGIIDSVKVLRCAIENAASAASLFITTECVITD